MVRRRSVSPGVAIAGAAAGFALATIISLGLGGPTPVTQAASVQPAALEAPAPIEAPAPMKGLEYGGESCGL